MRQPPQRRSHPSHLDHVWPTTGRQQELPQEGNTTCRYGYPSEGTLLNVDPLASEKNLSRLRASRLTTVISLTYSAVDAITAEGLYSHMWIMCWQVAMWPALATCYQPPAAEEGEALE